MKKSTHWVTIPEETLHTPVSNTGQKADAHPKETRPGEVKHKFFWGVGFVVVVIASFAVLAPQQFGRVLQGNLFDAPGVEAPDLGQAVPALGVLPSGDQTAAVVVEEEIPSADQTVVQPETTPVSIQVTPVVPAPTPAETVATETRAPAPAPQAELDANQRLIQELQKQVADLKAQQQTPSTVSIAPTLPTVPGVPGIALPGFLPGLTFSLPTDLRGAAPAPVTTTATLGQTATSPEGYRLNSHRVPISPQAVLEQYSRGGYRAPASYTLSAPATSTPVYYQADLSGVRGTPDTGPREVLLFTLILTFAGLLIVKASRLKRS